MDEGVSSGEVPGGPAPVGGPYLTIPLRGPGNYETKVSAADYSTIKDVPWRAQVNKRGHVYAAVRTKSGTVYLHRLICDTPSGLVTDHINGDTLDNRRENLRAVTQQVNCLNQTTPVRSSTGVRGVRCQVLRGQKTGRYQALINGRHLGIFPTVAAAKAAREEAVRVITEQGRT